MSVYKIINQYDMGIPLITNIHIFEIDLRIHCQDHLKGNISTWRRFRLKAVAGMTTLDNSLIILHLNI